MHRSTERQRALAAAAHELAGLRLEVSLLRLGRALERRFDPSQPRWPAGNSEGGRWSGGKGSGWTTVPGARGGRVYFSHGTDAEGNAIASAINDGDPDFDWDERHVVVAPDGTRTVFETKDQTQTIRDGETGAILSRSTWGPNGPEPDAVVQDAQLRLLGQNPAAAAGALAAGVAAARQAASDLYNWLGKEELPEQPETSAPTVSLRIRSYSPTAAAAEVEWTGVVEDKDVDSFCPERGRVQALTDEAARTVGASRYYPSASVYGTKVHAELNRLVKAEQLPNLKPEVSTTKTQQEARYGEPGSIRIDVLEDVGNGTACVFDIKTGRSGLKPARMLELAIAANRRFPGTSRLIVIETRPRLQP